MEYALKFKKGTSGAVVLDAKLQQAWNVYYSFGRTGKDLDISERTFTRYRKGEAASAKREHAEMVIDALKKFPRKKVESGLECSLESIVLKDYIKKDTRDYCYKNEKTEKLIGQFLQDLKERGITRLKLAEKIRGEFNESYNAQTLKESLGPRKTIHLSLLERIWTIEAGWHAEKALLSYCGAESKEELIESDRVCVTDGYINQINTYILEHNLTRRGYARIANVESKTLTDFLGKKIKTTQKRILEPVYLELEIKSKEEAKKVEKIVDEFIENYTRISPIARLVFIDKFMRKHSELKDSLKEQLERAGYISPIVDSSIYHLLSDKKSKKIEDSKTENQNASSNDNPDPENTENGHNNIDCSHELKEMGYTNE